MDLKINDIVSGTISSTAFGGEGVLRTPKGVVFVPLAIEGDEVAARVFFVGKKFARANIDKLITPSHDRIEPRCQYFGICGGCQLQQMAYEQQLKVKRRFVLDAIVRTAHMPEPVIEDLPKGQCFNYRRHIRLQLNPLGYYLSHSNQIVQIDTCAIFDENLNLAGLRKCCAEYNLTGELTLHKAASNSFVAFFDLKHEFSQELAQKLLVKMTYLQGLVVKSPHSFFQLGDCHLSFDLNGLKLSYSPLAFVQANPTQSEQLYLDLAARVGDLHPTKSILDLYCGIGASSLLVAEKTTKLVAIEGNEEAIKMARYNALINKIDNVFWQVGDVDELALICLKKYQPELVIVNPPRTGLGKLTLAALLKQRPTHIFYISCQPPTLARDLAQLSQHYKLKSLQAYDMFPQTTHVESMVHLSINE